MATELTFWRLIELETRNAFMNMAIDEAIFGARIAGHAPNTVRFYRWQPSAVSIGRFQDIEKEAQTENCRRHSVDIVRRTTGGGSVYHDSEGEITYSVIARKEDLGTEDIAEIYFRVYAGLGAALRMLGVQADFNEGSSKVCPNLTVNGRKISGSAQAHRKGVVLQHGTLLLKANLERMFTFLRVPWAKTRSQVVNIAKNKITSISEELGKEMPLADVNDALLKGFEKSLAVQFKAGRPTAREVEKAETLYRRKYATDEWNCFGKIRQ